MSYPFIGFHVPVLQVMSKLVCIACQVPFLPMSQDSSDILVFHLYKGVIYCSYTVLYDLQTVRLKLSIDLRQQEQNLRQKSDEKRF